MTLWIVLLGMAVLATACLVVPLFLRRSRTPARRDQDVALYRDQLAEVERDLGRGLISPGDAEAARAEIGRRLLASAERGERLVGTSRATRISVAVVLAAVVPLAALALYVNLGAPTIPDQPFAERQQDAARMAAEARSRLASQLAELDAKVKADPKDLQSWLEIGRLNQAHGRHRAAAEALSHAYELSGYLPELAADYGEALVLADGGVVGATAKQAFQASLAAAPRNPRARFYLGLERVQAGDVRGGLRDWLGLEIDSPADAPWLAMLRERIQTVVKEEGIDQPELDRLRGETVAALAELRRPAEKSETAGAITEERQEQEPESAPAPEAAGDPAPAEAGSGGGAAETAALDAPAEPGPTEADVKAAEELTPEQRTAMINSMVEQLAARLQTSPDDLAGWRRLGRAYMVLDQPTKAVDAFSRAAVLAPANVDVLIDYGEALLAAAGPTDRLPSRFVQVIRDIYALDDRNPVALWYLGLDHVQAGRRAEGAVLWHQLLERLPPEAPERAALAKRLEMLKIDVKPER